MAVTEARQGAQTQASDRDDARGGIRLLRVITESKVFKGFILLCIVVNAITLGVEAHFGEDTPIQPYIMQLDAFFLTVYTVEILLEFLAQGPRRWAKDGWNWFDFLVVGASYLATIPAVAALRTFRVFRVLRLVSNVPQMRRVAEALIGAMPGILAVSMVLALVFYIGAVMATTLFGGQIPQKFGDLAVSSLTLFQLALFDNWGDTVAEVNQYYPGGGIFLLVFTILSAFAVLNLFIGVIVDAVQAARDAESKAERREIREGVTEIGREVDAIAHDQDETHRDLAALLAEVRALRIEIAALRNAQQ